MRFPSGTVTTCDLISHGWTDGLMGSCSVTLTSVLNWLARLFLTMLLFLEKRYNTCCWQCLRYHLLISIDRVNTTTHTSRVVFFFSLCWRLYCLVDTLKTSLFTTLSESNLSFFFLRFHVFWKCSQHISQQRLNPCCQAVMYVSEARSQLSNGCTH